MSWLSKPTVTHETPSTQTHPLRIRGPKSSRQGTVADPSQARPLEDELQVAAGDKTTTLKTTHDPNSLEVYLRPANPESPPRAASTTTYSAIPKLGLPDGGQAGPSRRGRVTAESLSNLRFAQRLCQRGKMLSSVPPAGSRQSILFEGQQPGGLSLKGHCHRARQLPLPTTARISAIPHFRAARHPPGARAAWFARMWRRKNRGRVPGTQRQHRRSGGIVGEHGAISLGLRTGRR